MTVICGLHYSSGEQIQLEIADGRIVRYESRFAQQESRESGTGKIYVAPGLIDLQINGYLGEDFNSLPLSNHSIKRFCQHMWRLGVVKCYPTLITNSFDALKEALHVIRQACESDPLIEATIAGIHLEGPFISPHDGARGAHDLQFVCPPNIEWLDKWQEASGERIKIITLSPEWEGSEAFIKYCKGQGIIASIGHTSASSEQVDLVVAAGATMVTHFGNGVELQLPRHPNYLWEQLASDELYTCVIADGYHLPVQVLKVVHKVKGKRMLLVSDAVALAGSPPGHYQTFVGGDVILTEAGKLHLAHNDGLLAGSVASLVDGIQHMQHSGITSMAEAWKMASQYPAELMELPNAAGLTEGAPAELVLFELDNNGRPQVKRTFVKGQCVFQQS